MKIALLALISQVSLAAIRFEIRGTVADLEKDHVVIATAGGLVRVAKVDLTTEAVRPGQNITIPMGNKTVIEVLDEKKTPPRRLDVKPR